VSKYGGSSIRSGLFSSPRIGDNQKAELLELASHGVAVGTWKSYKTAERMLATYHKEQGQRLQLPVTEDTVLGFIHWLIYKRGVKGATVNNYIAGIRMLHITKGAPMPNLRTDFVKLVIAGTKHRDAGARLRGEAAPERKPVTTDVLRLLKAELKAGQYTQTDKLTLWTVCAILFHGAFRGGELLARQTGSFDPAFTLLREDIQKSGASTIQLRIKMPKEDKDGRATILEVYATGTDICPVKAFDKWEKATCKWENTQPAFRWQSGIPLTTKQLNSVLRRHLDKHTKCKYRVHSFRSGLASTMAALGCPDEEIKSMGRWSSRAYEDYIKLPKVKRARVARKLTTALMKL